MVSIRRVGYVALQDIKVNRMNGSFELIGLLIHVAFAEQCKERRSGVVIDNCWFIQVTRIEDSWVTVIGRLCVRVVYVIVTFH